jgi:hypothetical protein
MKTIMFLKYLWLPIVLASCQRADIIPPLSPAVEEAVNTPAAHVALAETALTDAKKATTNTISLLFSAQNSLDDAAKSTTLIECKTHSAKAGGFIASAQHSAQDAVKALLRVEASGNHMATDLKEQSDAIARQNDADSAFWSGIGKWCGLGAVLAGIALAVAAFSPWGAIFVLIGGTTTLEAVTVALFGASLVCLTIARYLHLIERIAFIAAFIALVYLIARIVLHYREKLKLANLRIQVETSTRVIAHNAAMDAQDALTAVAKKINGDCPAFAAKLKTDFASIEAKVGEWFHKHL